MVRALRFERLALASVAIGIATITTLACVGDDPSNVVPPGSDATPDDARGQGDTNDPSSCTCDGAPCFEGVCGGAKIEELAVGATFACARRASGSVWCWGINVNGQLGEADRKGAATCSSGVPCYPTPAPVPGLKDVVQMSAGGRAICVTTKDGEVYCWGENKFGELGPIDTSSKCGDSACVKRPTKVEGLPAVAKVSLGRDASCVLTKAKEIYCWGRNDLGQLGVGSTKVDWQRPAKVNLPRLATNITISASNGTNACAIVDDATVYCWGFNAHGQLGRTTTEPELCRWEGQDLGCSRSPILFPGLSDVEQIVAGDGHTCARTASGKVLCAGYRGYGIGELDHARDVGITEAKHLAGQNQHICATTTSGQVLCLGVSTEARLGFIESDYTTCVAGYDLPPCRKAPYSVGVTARTVESFNVSAALRDDGRVVAWGSNAFGLLGHPSGEGDVTCAKPGAGVSAPCSATPQLIPNLP